MSHSNNDQSYISKRTFKAFDTEKEDDEYIFVSYSHKDADEVFPELLRFHEEGYNIWYDEGIFGGTKCLLFLFQLTLWLQTMSKLK